MRKSLSTLAALGLLFALVLGATTLLSHAQDDQLAPDGVPRETYYAPFPVAIALDGDLSDWDGVPTVTMPEGAALSTGEPAVTFAGAADADYLYFMADVIDDNIISGAHGDEYWNEDSVEFYINATGNLDLIGYRDGVAQVTIPALNKDRSPDEIVISGMRGTTVDARAVVVETATGWVAEVAMPLENDVWSIEPEHGGVLGFQVHLNGASTANRDTKLIWSIFDQNDRSYLDPSVFGTLIFFEIGQSDIPQPALPEPTPTPVPIPADAAYKDPERPVAERVEDLLARMTLGEKIGQMTLVEKNSIQEADITALQIGGLLSGGGAAPRENNASAWLAMVNGFQEYALETRLAIPLLYGVDAVHGHNNVFGATIFPHNIGLGATRDPDLVQRIGRATALEMIATGIYWNYAPAVTVPQDIRWGRTYEGYSEDTALVTLLGTAYLRGLQGDDLSDPLTVLGTPKHFVGDGGTAWRTGTVDLRFLDRGDTQVDEATLRAVHLPPYAAAIDAGAQCIMVSFSSWNGENLHGHRYLLTDVLKGELGFEGFIVSDWGGIDYVAPDYYDAVVQAINAGVDMNMVPQNYQRFIQTLTEAVENGDVPVERIDDAVRRILTVKFKLGLFERPFGDGALLASVGSQTHRDLAREAAAKSAVLLKNEGNVLPLDPDNDLILVAGSAANNLGIQLGGWSISWRGGPGDTTLGTTILEAIRATVNDPAAVVYDQGARFNDLDEDVTASTCIGVVGELPYAEWFGDDPRLELSTSDTVALARLRERCENVVVVLISGRPLIVTRYLPDWNALVAAWLPGTEGQGIADVLFGARPFTGKLPYTWPRSVDQLPRGAGTGQPLFPFGYGLETTP